MAFSAGPPSSPSKGPLWPLPESVHEPGDEHCGVGGPPKRGRPLYRYCRCGLLYHWTAKGWRPKYRSARWLRRHGVGRDAVDFLTSTPFLHSGPQAGRDSPVGEPSLTGGWRYLLRPLRYRLNRYKGAGARRRPDDLAGRIAGGWVSRSRQPGTGRRR
jgi:hypothetical protein